MLKLYKVTDVACGNDPFTISLCDHHAEQGISGAGCEPTDGPVVDGCEACAIEEAPSNED
jgi:hypothetical protein